MTMPIALPDSFLRQAWYFACWQEQIATGKLFARTILNEPIVFFRDSKQRVHALEDRCPHRWVPLHLGKLCDDTIECGYHGLRFAADGTCVHNPHAPTIPARARVRSYGVAEVSGAVWIWLGDESPRCPPEQFPGLDPRTHHVATGYLAVQASYLLAMDNALDLSHLEFLHPQTLGGSGISGGSVEVRTHGDSVQVLRRTHSERLPRAMEIAFQVPPGAAADRSLDVRWTPPGTAVVDIRVQAQGRSEEKTITSFHFYTPQTENTCHYHFAIALSKAVAGHGPAAAQIGLKALREPFEQEDRMMLEAQQRLLGARDINEVPRIVLPGDSAAAHARRVISRLLARERGRAEAADIRKPSEKPDARLTGA